ncbi:CAP domain-containing protein [Legionella drozanskii]|nr:CAP domain-containing protein [Legionella drozanskii]
MMRKFKILVLVSFLMSLFQSTIAAQSPIKKTETVDSANQKAILVYVNEYRAKRGLKPLKMNNLMSAEAAKHSRDMANHAIPFGHQYFDKRIHRLFNAIQQCQGGSENVAYNYKDAKDVVRNWLTSRGHRRNIEGNYNLTGIGLARDKRGKLYFTQIFLRTTNPAYLQKSVG